MFRKLLKQEWKATWKIMVLLTGGLIVLFLLGHCGLHLYNCQKSWPTDSIRLLVENILQYLYWGLGLLLVSYLAAIPLLLAWRFYQNKFTDQGYLTFTLPVKPTQLYWSHAVNTMLWSAISLLTVSVLLFLTDLLVNQPPTASLSLPGWTQIPSYLSLSYEELQNIEYSVVWKTLLYIALPASISLSWSSVSLPVTCVTLGTTLSRRYKLLAAIGFLYVLAVVMILLALALFWPLLYAFAALISPDGISFAPFLCAYWACMNLSPLSVSLWGYWLSLRRMKKKLNLN